MSRPMILAVLLLCVPVVPAFATQQVEERITRDMDPVRAAAQMDVDEVIAPGELRCWLEAALAMSYQSIGYRRVKNPRIWSLHDLKVLAV